MNPPAPMQLSPAVLRLFVNPSPPVEIKSNYDPIINIAGWVTFGNILYQFTDDYPRDGREWDYLEHFLSVKSDEIEFKRLATEWKRETGHFSLVEEKIIHPKYLEIIGMGDKALPFLINEMRKGSAHWFPALRAIARNTRPKDEGSSFDEAVKVWTNWWNERQSKHAGMDFAG